MEQIMENLFETVQPPSAPPCGIVIFGASGRRAQQSFIPALYDLFVHKNLPDEFFVLGVGRSSFSDETFRTALGHTLAGNDDTFTQHCFYLQGDYRHSAAYLALWEKLTALHASFGTGGNVLFIIATPRTLYEAIAGHLNNTGLITRHQNHAPYQRLLLEKPFDAAQTSAHTITRHLLRFASDDQVYRMDCLLHPVFITRMMLFRLTNPLFARQWDRSTIDAIEIRYWQKDGIEGQSRHFDDIGLVRHILPGMLLHLLAPITMEPPARLNGDAVRDELTKLLRAIRAIEPHQMSRGQYTANPALNLPGYKDEHGQADASSTETRFKLQLAIDNQRWRDVPVYLQAGIGIDRDLTEVIVHFRDLAHQLMPGQQDSPSNTLSFVLQPEVQIAFGCRVLSPDAVTQLGTVVAPIISMSVEDIPNHACSAHLLAALRGEQSPFWRSDAMDAVWVLLAPVLRWIDEDVIPLHYYERGKSW